MNRKSINFVVGKNRISMSITDDDTILIDISSGTNYSYVTMTKDKFKEFMRSMVDFFNAMQIEGDTEEDINISGDISLN